MVASARRKVWAICLAVLGLAYDLYALVGGEHLRQSLAEYGVVVGQEHLMQSARSLLLLPVQRLHFPFPCKPLFKGMKALIVVPATERGGGRVECSAQKLCSLPRRVDPVARLVYFGEALPVLLGTAYYDSVRIRAHPDHLCFDLHILTRAFALPPTSTCDGKGRRLG